MRLLVGPSVLLVESLVWAYATGSCCLAVRRLTVRAQPHGRTAWVSLGLLVLMPETVAAVRAALRNRLQTSLRRASPGSQ